MNNQKNNSTNLIDDLISLGFKCITSKTDIYKGKRNLKFNYTRNTGPRNLVIYIDYVYIYLIDNSSKITIGYINKESVNLDFYKIKELIKLKGVSGNSYKIKELIKSITI